MRRLKMLLGVAVGALLLTGCPPADTVAPPAPASAAPTAVSCTQVNLAWPVASDNVGGSGIRDYDVYRDGTVVGTTAARWFADRGLAPGSSHTYTLRARDNANNVSAPSANRAVNGPACPAGAPTVPTLIRVAAADCMRIDLQWNGASDSSIRGYILYRDGVAFPETLNVANWSQGGLDANVTYTYQIRAVAHTGVQSDLSAPQSAATPECTGEMRWNRTAGSDNADWAETIAANSSGNVLVGGEFAKTINLGGGALVSKGQRDVFVAKLSAAGAHQWSRAFGGGGSGDHAYGIAADAAGNVYVVGTFASPTDFGNGPVASAGGEDGYVLKYSPTGALLWVRTFGASGEDRAYAVALDTAGNVFVSGMFQGAVDFGAGPIAGPAAPGYSGYVTKFSPAGVPAWTRSAGGSLGNGVAVDSAGNVVVGGKFSGGSLAGNWNGGSFTGTYDAYVVKFTNDGTYVWSKSLGNSTDQLATAAINDVAVDASGNIAYIATFNGPNADFGTGPLTGHGGDDVVVAQLAATGTPQWLHQVGNLGHDNGHEVAIDAQNNVVASGSFRSTVDFGGGPRTAFGSSDMFVAKYAANGAHVWSRGYGGSNIDVANAIAVHPTQGLLVGGGYEYEMRDHNGYQLYVSQGQADIFIANIAG